jgi:4-hydroxybenzoate polyprenyltransferase
MKVINILLFIIVFSTIILAQSSFPSAPTQTPIGGLGLLAAAGGAMALKKFMDRKK